MVNKITPLLLALSLIPAPAMAQRFGGAHRGGGFGFGGHGVVRGFGGLAPFPGFGNINHPGLGFAPNTPGIGFSLRPGFHSPRIIGRPFFGFGQPFLYRRSFGFFGLGGVVGVPVLVNGYGGFPYAASESPTIIIIQQPGGQGGAQIQGQELPRNSRGLPGLQPESDKDVSLVYEAPSRSVPAKPARPLTLLAFKDHTIVAATNYWKQGDRLCYSTSYGLHKCVALDLLDVPFTQKLNEERNVRFEM